VSPTNIQCRTRRPTRVRHRNPLRKNRRYPLSRLVTDPVASGVADSVPSRSFEIFTNNTVRAVHNNNVRRSDPPAFFGRNDKLAALVYTVPQGGRYKVGHHLSIFVSSVTTAFARITKRNVAEHYRKSGRISCVLILLRYVSHPLSETVLFVNWTRVVQIVKFDKTAEQFQTFIESYDVLGLIRLRRFA